MSDSGSNKWSEWIRSGIKFSFFFFHGTSSEIIRSWTKGTVNGRASSAEMKQYVFFNNNYAQAFKKQSQATLCVAGGSCSDGLTPSRWKYSTRGLVSSFKNTQRTGS